MVLQITCKSDILQEVCTYECGAHTMHVTLESIVQSTWTLDAPLHVGRKNIQSNHLVCCQATREIDWPVHEVLVAAYV